MTKSGWKVEVDEGYVKTLHCVLSYEIIIYSAYFDINYIF